MKKIPRALKTLAACAVSAALLNLSYPLADLSHLAWIAFVPALGVADRCGVKGAYFVGFLFGFFAYLAGFDWMANLAENFMFIPRPFNWGVHFLFCLNAAQPFALSMLLRAWLNPVFPRFSLVAFPSVFTAISLFYPVVFPFSLADGQSEFPLALQMTEYFGAAGLSWFILSANEFFLRVPKYFVGKAPRGEAAVFVAFALFWFGAGYARLIHWEKETESWKKYPVGLVQPNQKIAFNERVPHAEKISGYEFGASLRLAAEDPVFIAWPEGVTHGYFRDRRLKKFFDGFLSKLQTPLIVQELVSDRSGSYNSALLFNAEGGVADVYHKQKLILFGESIPFEDLTNYFLRFLGLRMTGFSAGTEQKSFSVGEVEVLPRICYESLFSGFTAEGMAVGGGKKLILFLTESEWYDSAKQVRQHAKATLVRAVENRAPLLHVINGGHSNLILPTGEIAFEAPYREPGAYLLRVPYEASSPITFFSRYPWPVVSFCFVFSFGLIGLAGIQKVRIRVARRRAARSRSSSIEKQNWN